MRYSLRFRALETLRSWPSWAGLSALLCLLPLVAAACGARAPLEIPTGCNPLAAELDCLLPFPSDVFRVADMKAVAGVRMQFPEPALPHTVEGEGIDFTRLHPADGASLAPTIFALMPQAIDDASLVFHTGDVTKSLLPESPTLLLSAQGEAILHFAELDPRPEDPARRALFVRPMVRLQPSTRYLVAFHDLRGADGALLPAPEGFARLRDKETRGDPVLGPLAAHYEDSIFPQLKQAGLRRKDLQLAWDFTTGSELRQTRDLFSIRKQILKTFASKDPAVKVNEVLDDVSPELWRVVHGTISLPLFMDGPNAGARLLRSPDRLPRSEGQSQQAFTIIIPRSVGEAAAGSDPARMIQFGHGFFGGRGEIEDGFMPAFANRLGVMVGAVDWQGMSRSDAVTLGGDLLSDLGNATRFVDRLHQGMAGQLAFAFALRSSIATLPELQRSGRPLYDPSTLYFYGISNGQILGQTFVALAPFFHRVGFSVGGMGYGFMMYRAQPFAPLLELLGTEIPDLFEQQKLTAMMQFSLDRIDPISYAPRLLQDPLPGNPRDRRILMQMGIGDASVPNLGSHLAARALGLAHLVPAPRPIVGLEDVPAPYAGSGLVEFDLGIPEPLPGTYALPAEEGNAVHGGVRQVPAGQDQLDAFFHPGSVIEQFCEGPCDPE